MERFAQAGTLYEIGLHRVGLKIITLELRQAAKAYSHALTNASQALKIEQSLAFLRGTDLDVVIETFSLSLDADRLRDTFFSWAPRLAPLSSATIAAPS